MFYSGFMVDTPKHFDVDALRKAASSVPDEEKKRLQAPCLVAVPKILDGRRSDILPERGSHISDRDNGGRGRAGLLQAAQVEFR
jgi:hypothetical protein